MELTLVRHTTLNIEPGICYGQSDILPSDTFEREAEAASKILNGKTFDAVYSSNLSRCTMLAGQCGFGNYKVDKRLAEYNFGNWELIPWEKITGQYAEKWFNDYINVPAPNGESLQDVINRIASFLQEIRQSELKSVLCFTHSGPIRIFQHLINNIAISELFNLEIAYAGVYSYTI